MAAADPVPLLLAGGAIYLLSKPRNKSMPPPKAVMPDTDYTHSCQPVVPLADVLFSNSVRGKNVILQRTERGPEGSVKYVYYLPDSNQLCFSYAPLEMDQNM